MVCSVPVAHAMLAASFSALFACWGNSAEFGLQKIEFRDFCIIFAAYLGIILLGAAVAPLWEELLSFLNIECAKEQEIVELFRSAGKRDRVFILISTCIITPVVEEVLFRRIIYSSWHHIHPPTAFFGTSLIFSLAHFFLMGIPGLLIMGLAFQLAYLIRENLLTAMLLHSVVNTMAFFINIFGETNIR